MTNLIPADAVDTHVHVFDPRLGPYSSTRAYTPADATLDQLLNFSGSISASGRPVDLVIVQPSPYSTDNQVLLGVLKQLQDEGSVARGIAVVDLSQVTDDDLLRMHQLGVRGLRLNMQASGHDFDVTALKEVLKKAAGKIQHLPSWMLQIFAPARVWDALYDTILELPVSVIADHCGGLLGASKLETDSNEIVLAQAGFAALISLAQQGKILIKISGLYRSSLAISTNFSDMMPIISVLAESAPDALIWGSDWPHTGEGKSRALKNDVTTTEAFRVIDNKGVVANVFQAISNEETWMRMMVHNPRRIFQ